MLHVSWQAQHFCILGQDVGGSRHQFCGRGAISVLETSYLVEFISRGRCKDMEVKNANRGGTVRSKFACNSLQLSNLKEVSKKMLVFKIQLPNWEKVSQRQPVRKTNIQVDSQTDRQIDRYIHRYIHR